MFLKILALWAPKNLKNKLLREELDLHSLKDPFIIHLCLPEDIRTEKDELDVDISPDCMTDSMKAHICFHRMSCLK